VNPNAVLVCQHDTLSVVLSIFMPMIAICMARELSRRINLRCQRFGEPAGYEPDSL
jgi:hypothetical protein